MRYSHLALLPAFVVGASFVSAQVSSNGTGGGAWTTGSTWTGGNVPATTSGVNILASDTVTATGAGTVHNSIGATNSSIFGTLTVGAGTTITSTGRLNPTATTNYAGGILNVQGGSVTFDRIMAVNAVNQTGNFTINVSSGSVEATNTSNMVNTTVNISGGVFRTGGSSAISTNSVLNLTGGSFSYTNGIANFNSSTNLGTWSGGRITTNTSTFNLNVASGTFFSKLSGNSANVWDLSDKSAKQTFSTTSSTAANITGGQIEFGIYSSAANDNDMISFTSAGLTLSSGVSLNIVAGTTLTGETSDYIGKSYKLFDRGTLSYSTLSPSISATYLNISGTDYLVGWTNNLTTDGSLTIASLTASSIPEPSTFAVLAGLTTLAFITTRRVRSARE